MSDFYRSGTRPPPALRTSGPSAYKQRRDTEIKLVRVAKRKRQRHVLHGAGTWKIAYADFATAMMAFFMLLWMMVALKPEQKVGLATYFDPQTLTFAKTSGAGGILGGRSIAEEGSSVASYAPKTSADKLNQTRDEEAKPGAVLKDHSEAQTQAPAALPPKSEADKRIMQWLEKRWTQLQAPALSEEDKRKISEQVEAAEFRKAADDLHQAIQNSVDGAQLEKNLLVEQTPEGLRIQLVDQERTPMFALGSTELNDTAKRLIALVVQAIKNLPHKVAITGHTDGNPYRAGDYTNWDLSVGRANASRRLLIDNGLDSSRIASVVGKADTEHLVTDDPLAPANRRISFLLLRLRPVTNVPTEPPPASAVP